VNKPEAGAAAGGSAGGGATKMVGPAKPAPGQAQQNLAKHLRSASEYVLNYSFLAPVRKLRVTAVLRDHGMSVLLRCLAVSGARWPFFSIYTECDSRF
jgi:hypothetical protein